MTYTTRCSLGIFSAFMVANTMAAEPAFVINKSNCNLPVKEIRKIIPNKKEQQRTLERCMEKATKERWGHNNKKTRSSTT